MSRANLPKTCQECTSRDKGIFCGISDPELEPLNKAKVENLYKKGQTLFVEGNPPYGLFCVSSGNIKVTKTSPDGKNSIVRIATAGDVLGHRSIYTDENYSATATAMEDTIVCFLDRKFILEYLDNNSSASRNLLAKLSRDLGASENRISSFSSRNVEERLAELLLILARTHGEDISERKRKINLKLTREELASMLGTATETIIRSLSDLKNDGIIEQEGKTLIIKKQSALADIADIQV